MWVWRARSPERLYMQNIGKSLTSLVLSLFIVAAAQAATVYQETFDGSESWPHGLMTFGSGNAFVAGGQMTLSVPNLGHAGVGLDMGTLSPGYSTVLRSNSSTVSWAANVANQDLGQNNGFQIVLACDSLDPYGISAVGYALKGGGLVGNSMILYRFDHGLGGGGSIVIDIPSTNGLGILPAEGSFKVSYTPSGDNWSVFGQIGTSYVDPTLVSTLLGSGTDSTYTGGSLPYFELSGISAGVDYFDNVSIVVAPEPSVLALSTVGIILLIVFRRRLTRFA
jgi:hypothetical protein